MQFYKLVDDDIPKINLPNQFILYVLPYVLGTFDTLLMTKRLDALLLNTFKP